MMLTSLSLSHLQRIIQYDSHFPIRISAEIIPTTSEWTMSIMVITFHDVSVE